MLRDHGLTRSRWGHFLYGIIMPAFLFTYQRAIFIGLLMGMASPKMHSQTILSGNTSGTWALSGNPYIIVDNVVVPGGQTLLIEPGVTVWIGEGRSITVNGGIRAAGTPTQRITFKAPLASQYWDSIVVNNNQTNVFTHCDFNNGRHELMFFGTSSNHVSHCRFSDCPDTALALSPDGTGDVRFSSFHSLSNGISITGREVGATIANCSFTNCSGFGVFAISSSTWSWNSTVTTEIRNCLFSSVNSACYFHISGVHHQIRGYGHARLYANIFHKIDRNAIAFTEGGWSGESTAVLMNNVIVAAENAIAVRDPWDAKVQNNIVVSCTNGISVSGALSRMVSYNDFFQNGAAFVGYPATYGNVILNNRNGVPCDLLYNIFHDPKFTTTDTFGLATNSPCIDAGTSDPTWFDVSFPPSQGGNFPDLGAYGGPLANAWSVTPELRSDVLLTAAKAMKLTSLEPVGRGAYQLEAYTKIGGWTDFGPPIYHNGSNTFVSYIDPTNNASYFRLKRVPPGL